MAGLHLAAGFGQLVAGKLACNAASLQARRELACVKVHPSQWLPSLPVESCILQHLRWVERTRGWPVQLRTLAPPQGLQG